ncbi:MAG TPA: hypothetical protein VFK32_05120 [Tepidiformaceae bacterium]|nr:hypothetical protein [Tepidiformaceae bacterium]
MALVLGALALGACGDGDSTPATPTPDATDPAGYHPDVSDLGYERLPTNGVVITQPGAKILRYDYQMTGDPTRKLTVYAYVYEEEAVATTTYATLRDALRNPPPGSLGAQDAKNEDTAGPELGDEQHSYRVTRAVQGKRIWSDIYRFGNVIYVIQVLDRDEADQMELREEIASRAGTKAGS